jgi:uncharacterized membrane protein
MTRAVPVAHDGYATAVLGSARTPITAGGSEGSGTRMWRAALLGVVTGMRSQVPGALLAWRRSRGQLPHDVAGPGGVLRRRTTLPLTLLAAAGEMVGDKLPTTPGRLEDGPFLGRVALGAGAGSGVAAAFGRSRIAGAPLGAAGAAAGSVAGYRLRVAAVARTGVPDTAWGLLEDALAVALGLLATRADPADTQR